MSSNGSPDQALAAAVTSEADARYLWAINFTQAHGLCCFHFTCLIIYVIENRAAEMAARSLLSTPGSHAGGSAHGQGLDDLGMNPDASSNYCGGLSANDIDEMQQALSNMRAKLLALGIDPENLDSVSRSL